MRPRVTTVSCLAGIDPQRGLFLPRATSAPRRATASGSQNAGLANSCDCSHAERSRCRRRPPAARSAGCEGRKDESFAVPATRRRSRHRRSISVPRRPSDHHPLLDASVDAVRGACPAVTDGPRRPGWAGVVQDVSLIRGSASRWGGGRDGNGWHARWCAVMGAVGSFGLAVLVAALAATAAVLSSRASERLRVPAPAFFLVGAAVASDIWPRLGALSFTTVERVVTLALAVILFDGGMRVGWRRFRPAAAAIIWLGVAGTLVTAAAVAAAAHFCSRSAGVPRCCWARRWRPPTRRWCFPCWAGARSAGAAACCWRGSPAPTTRSASPCWSRC